MDKVWFRSGQCQHLITLKVLVYSEHPQKFNPMSITFKLFEAFNKIHLRQVMIGLT